MRLIIEAKDNSISDIRIEDFGSDDEKMALDDVFAILFCVMENVAIQAAEDNQGTDVFYDYLATVLNVMYGRLLYKVLPDHGESEFDLSDAAILYGQDQIIKRAEKKGITFEEALEEYEKKAEAYVRKRAKVFAS